jgi:hypothetical protein
VQAFEHGFSRKEGCGECHGRGRGTGRTGEGFAHPLAVIPDAARAAIRDRSPKSMAPSVADCEAMIRAGREAGRKLMIAYRAQYEPFNL